MKLVLYYAPGACSLASHIALEETGVPFDAVRIVLGNQEQRSASYLAINPRGKVPTLCAGGRVITENVAILSYLASAYPEAHLLPFDDPPSLGRAYELMSWLTTSVQISFAQMWRPERFVDEDEAKRVLLSDGRRRVLLAFDEIEQSTGSDRWLLGERFSAVDGLLLVFWRWGKRLEINMADYPNWARHTDRLLERPSVQRVMSREESAIRPVVA